MTLIHHRKIRSKAWEQKIPPSSCPSQRLCIVLIVTLLIFLLQFNQFDIVQRKHQATTIPARKGRRGGSHTHNHHLRHHHHDHHQQQQQRQPHYDDDFESIQPIADALIVGSGLAGLTTALRLLDRGATKVIIYEKESQVGGNSAKASSGINACCLPEDQKLNNDTIALFRQDTITSAGNVADLELIETLVENSAAAIMWLHDRVGVDLSLLVQLGGHTRQRTHRPQRGFVGAEIIAAMHDKLRQYEAIGRVSIRTSTQVTQLITNNNYDNADDNVDDDEFVDDDRVFGIVTESLDGHYGRVRSDHVVLATGGFASDRSPHSLLANYRPDLTNFAATAGPFSTGDGIALAERVGATTRDMEKIQLHPTGFVDPNDPMNPNKVLAAELLRGYGGILLDENGKRFCNELGTRSYVTDRMLHRNDHFFHKFRTQWTLPHQRMDSVPTFFLVLSSGAAEKAQRHIKVYERKDLVQKIQGISALADFMGISFSTLKESLIRYRSSASKGIDEFGKTTFTGIPLEDDENEVFYVGVVTPVLHYCMGGLKINSNGNVLGLHRQVIKGLYAAGEVTGGVHGQNRLGGNSLLECAVFGSIIGEGIPIANPSRSSIDVTTDEMHDNPAEPVPIVTLDELTLHSSKSDCWVALHQKVFDLTDFVDRHPGGQRSIESLCGSVGTATFDLVHGDHILSNLQHAIVGILKHDTTSKERDVEDGTLDKSIGGQILPDISMDDLQRHKNQTWVALYDTVYDLSKFSTIHPGGEYIIHKSGGNDGTQRYSVFHPRTKLDTIQHLAVGRLQR